MEMATGTRIESPSEANLHSQGSDEMYGKYLTFWADSQLFGIPIADVVQIVGVQTITKIPEFPEYAKGIIDLRGSIIPVIDVRLRLHKEEIPYDERTCIIVTNIQENLIGLIVDSVNEVANIEDENISQPPKIAKDTTNAYLTGVAKLQDKVVLLLNTEKILKNEEIAEIIQN
ncbi:MAG TPA: chemotaxis protein CheW [Oscillospiraceae bacterium]|nr:chemotaxis protein CheW [Oscillospiraceae bacterium]